MYEQPPGAYNASSQNGQGGNQPSVSRTTSSGTSHSTPSTPKKGSIFSILGFKPTEPQPPQNSEPGSSPGVSAEYPDTSGNVSSANSREVSRRTSSQSLPSSPTKSAMSGNTTVAVDNRPSFLQRATQFFQQQFQPLNSVFDAKPQNSEEDPTRVELNRSNSAPTTNVSGGPTQSQTVQSRPGVPTSNGNSQSTVSPYRQMPIITREQYVGSTNSQYLTSKPDQAQRNYLQPNNRGQRKASSDRTLDDRGYLNVPNSSDATGRNRRGSIGNSKNSPSTERKHRSQQNVGGRPQAGKCYFFSIFGNRRGSIGNNKSSPTPEQKHTGCPNRQLR